MPKNNLVPTGGTSVMPKVIGTLVVLGLLAVVVKHPGDAAAWVTGMAAWLESVVDGVAEFFRLVGS